MELNNGKYQIGNIDALSLCEKYDTPLYVYDGGKIKSQFQRFMNAFSDADIKINYACKALSNINILRLLCKLGSGLDAVSIYEVELALKAGFKPEDIVYTPNSISFEEIQEGIEKGVHVTIDNISILEKFGQTYGNKVPVSVRLNPHVMAGGNIKISTGHADSKFGISIYQVPDILQVVEKYSINVTGVHMHTGSDILDVDVFLKAVNILLDAAKKFTNLESIDFGSGFKVKYKPDDVFTDIELFGKELTLKQKEFVQEYGKPVKFMFEPGKFLVSEAGYFLVKVNVLKHTMSTVFAGVNTGQNHLIRPMFYDAYHHIVNVSKPEGSQHIYSIVGYICETDTFAWNRQINEISEGDVLCFYNAGAYCFSMASNYNSRLRPAEVLVLDGKDYLIRKRETFDDLIRNQVEADF